MDLKKKMERIKASSVAGQAETIEIHNVLLEEQV